MKAETWVRVRQVFQDVVELPSEERVAFLEEVCAHEPEVKAEVERLLRQDESKESPLDRGELPTLKEAPPPGTRIGRYTLVRVVASGGMGTVFEATQDEPRRRVAVKMLRFGLDSPSRLRRFQYEAEVLGTLRHPGIAQIYEAGMHEAQPFFAMELVPGARDVLTYVDEEGLSIDECIALFVRVCDAVSHGHQKGVIHRDLKPGNILVDAEGQPKVIDFGVARAADTEHGSGITLETRAGQVVGTLQYMSPEQISGRRAEVDVRSDVYALGCVLYEMLTGELPYYLGDLSIAGVARTIEEAEPRRPRGLPVDLSWILSRALEKDPRRRYASASELRADLERYLANEPVLAGPPGRGYRLRKFVRRNRSAILAVGAVIVALSIGLLRAEIDARAAERARLVADDARGAAEIEAAKARGVTRFLRRTLTSAAPQDFGGKALVVDVLDEAARMVEEELGDEPEVLATVQHVIGDSYRAIGELDRAASHLESARRFVERELPPEDRFSIEVRATVALLLQNQRRYPEAEELTATLLPLAEAELGADDETTLRVRSVRAFVLANLGRAAEAEPLALTNLEIRRERYGDGHERLIPALSTLAEIRAAQGEFRDELALYEEIVAICEDRLPPDHYQLIEARMNLGTTYFELADWARSEEYLRPSLEWSRKELGAEHPTTLALLNNLANALMMQGRTDEALPLLEEAVPLTKKLFGERNLTTVQTLNNLSVSYNERELFEEAEAVCLETLELADGILPEDHDDVLRVRMNLGKALVGEGRLEEAEEIFLPTWEMSRDSLGRDHPVTLSHLAQLVYVQKLLGDWAELERYATELFEQGERSGRFREWSQDMLEEARTALAQGSSASSED